MRDLKFLTWLDVKRLVKSKTLDGQNLPDCISSISCFSDALEINIANGSCKGDAEKILSEWFKDWYDQNQDLIRLDLGDAVLPVEFCKNAPRLVSDSGPMRPFWREIAYMGDNSDEDVDSPRFPSKFHFPDRYPSLPKVIAFYSFKGGVGRTLHLASYLFALLEAAKEISKKITVLVVDGDLEAPGLTYWNHVDNQESAISFIDFLEAYHYSPIPRQDCLKLLAEEVKKNPRYEGGSTFYFVPACLHDEQLLDTPVLPEHLARSLENEWTCGDALHQLGAALEADYVLVDLRAGLSEISSPIIFDPRIQRFFVTSATDQSTAGISLVLKQISRIAPSEADSSHGEFYDPSIIISFLTPELKKLPVFESALEKLTAAYNYVDQSNDENLYSGRLGIKETDFTQELLYINSWEEAKNKLTATSVMKLAKEWAVSQLSEQNQSIEPVNSEDKTSNALIAVREFRDICEQYVFAESGKSESLLITESLKNLATKFRNQLPHIVSIGAKGSGKTFTYVQLSRLKFWEKFLKLATKDSLDFHSKTYIFPLLQSNNLEDAARLIVDAARSSTRSAFEGSMPEFQHSEFKDPIREFLEQSNNEIEWTRFWIQQISKSVGLDQDRASSSLPKLNDYLREKDVRLVFLFDGLEDLFANAATDTKQQTALKALIDLPKRLSEIRQANLGLIILLRRDFLRYSVTQNLAQFESLYKFYDLSWDFDSFLKLVYWVCSQASVIDAQEEHLDNLGREELISNLEQLWGKKLGQDTSREAYTANWIHAALTDFKGRLQARDIVRLLYHAANITLEETEEIQFGRWSTSRLLPPQAIRRAIEPCSAAKVKEVGEEYPQFKMWVKTELKGYKPSEKCVPFSLDTRPIDPSTIRMLEDIGVIYEDRGKGGISRYYMPEIYRSGLGFTLEKGARPRVLVLKRKALGADK